MLHGCSPWTRSTGVVHRPAGHVLCTSVCDGDSAYIYLNYSRWDHRRSYDKRGLQACQLTPGKWGKQCCKMIFKPSTSLDFMFVDSFESIIIFTFLYTFFCCGQHVSHTSTSLVGTCKSNIKTPIVSIG